MIAAFEPFSSIASNRRSTAASATTASRVGAALAIALGFLSFMPYPAIPIGRTSALQLGTLLSLLMLVLIPAVGLPWRHRPVYLYPLILAPLVLSAVKASFSESADLDLCIKAIAMTATASLTLIVIQLYAPRYFLHLLTGIAIATLLHVVVGLCQAYSFSQGEFPFADIYVNQSFLSVQENVDIIAKYIQRPFGLFPEPSAMASSLAPWIVFWVAELCGIVRLRQQPARWQRVLFASAAAGGLTLVLLSSSGHIVITLVALLVVALLWFRRLRATPRTFAIVLTIMCVVLPLLLWAATVIMSDRIEGETQVGGSSWDDRSSSLLVGFAVYAHGELPTILFGIGAGLSPNALWSAAKLDAVWSVLLSYIYETGLIGVAAVCMVGVYLLRVWRASGLNATFAAITVVWLVGITLTTSYEQLLPIWVALGWLTVWPAICESAAPVAVGRKNLILGQQDQSMGLPRQTWTVAAESITKVNA